MVTLDSPVPSELGRAPLDDVEEFSLDSQISVQGSSTYQHGDTFPDTFMGRDVLETRQTCVPSHWFEQHWLPHPVAPLGGHTGTLDRLLAIVF